jgi:negative regulator of sigma-B (phosphoserine phosphatase)
MEAEMSLKTIAVDGLPFGLAWSVSATGKHGASVSGDGYLIARSQDRLLIAVVDGSGSGEGAAKAAEECLEEISNSLSLALEGTFEACHRRLQGTRGAALALAEIVLRDPIELTWASVGDVDGQLLRGATVGRRQPLGLVQSRGTLGFSYDQIFPQSHVLAVGDVVLLTTDGISRSYRDQNSTLQSPADLTRSTIGRFGRKDDDRLALALAIVPAP